MSVHELGKSRVQNALVGVKEGGIDVDERERESEREK